jgi:hypothetical protein
MNDFLLIEVVGICVVVLVVVARTIIKRNREDRFKFKIEENESKGNDSGIRYCRSLFFIGIEEETDWHDILQQELERMPFGAIMFNPPETMTLGVRERIEARISQEFVCSLTDKLNGHGDPQVEELKISELMKIRMSGEDFNINTLNEEEQIIPKEGYTEWAWDVTPQKTGTRKLHLHVTLRIRLPYGEEKKDHPVLDRDVNVKINVKYSIKKFLKNNWKWVATTLAIPWTIWIWKLLGKHWFDK